jgi:3'-phosphoadenosine 5'-phosphosulfate sulfotransferase (PAPS reductase)/FAD synthetase
MLFISFSGGRTSAYMSKLILDSVRYKDIEKVFVFANTGKEREETLEFVHKCDQEFGLNLVWVEAVVNPENGIGTTFKIVDYDTADRKGKPFSDMIEKYGLSNKDFPHCTRELKSAPIKKFAQSLTREYKMAIGIRIDERKRINRIKADKEKWIYPLVDVFPTNKRTVLDFWANQDFDLNLNDYEGNCDLCWKKSLAKRIRILSENPHLGDQWEEWENNDTDGYVFDRDGHSVKELRKMAALSKDQLELDFSTLSCSCFF